MVWSESEMEGVSAAIPVPAGAQAAVSLVSDNLVAFALRAASARVAARTLDLQYYIWDEDVTGRLLIREVLRAADRGVRVRLLLDDLYVRRTERALAKLAQHPSIEVRLYNPFQLRSLGALGNLVEFLFAGYRLNHRMHNKTWIVDGCLAIGGGRNIGDEYFDAASQFNFRDLDVAVTGRPAQQTGALFDLYWNSPQRYVPSGRSPRCAGPRANWTSCAVGWTMQPPLRRAPPTGSA
jgi:putative cardiolipin synthase